MSARLQERLQERSECSRLPSHSQSLHAVSRENSLTPDSISRTCAMMETIHSDL